MRNAIILGGSFIGACAVGIALSTMYFVDTPAQNVDAMGPPPPETFAAVFEPCAHCHQIGDGARATSGPVLNNIIGAQAGATDFPYSSAVRDSGVVWAEETLRAFILRPSDIIPNSRMRFAGLDPAKLDALMAFLADPKPD